MTHVEPSTPTPSEPQQPPTLLSSVKNTAVASSGTAGSIILAMWLVHPNWPPPEAVVAAVVGAAAPALHLIGAGIMRKLAEWAGEAEVQKQPPPPAHP